MSYGYYIFDELVQDLTADEEGWIRDQCSGEFETCKFIHDFMAEYDEVIDSFYWPKNVGWPYEEDALEYQEEELAFIDFQWEIVTGAQGHRHLRFRDHETLDPPLPVAELIRRFLHKWRPNDTFSMKYSIISSDGDGSPGAFYITAERVEWMSIGNWLLDREHECQSSSDEVRCGG